MTATTNHETTISDAFVGTLCHNKQQKQTRTTHRCAARMKDKKIFGVAHADAGRELSLADTPRTLRAKHFGKDIHQHLQHGSNNFISDTMVYTIIGNHIILCYS